MHAQIASKFIAHYKQYLLTAVAVDENKKCTIENVEVECGEHIETLRRRDISDSKKTSKVPFTVKFATKVPLPSNASKADLNETIEQISSDIISVLNQRDLNLNISGVVLEYDASKPPVFRFVGLVCDKGQVLRGTKCGKTLKLQAARRKLIVQQILKPKISDKDLLSNINALDCLHLAI